MDTKKISTLLFLSMFGSLLITGCLPADQPTPIPQPPTPTMARIFPTPSVPGDRINWQDLWITLDGSEITDSFVTEFGSQRDPAAGQKFLWVHLQLKNTGRVEIDVPLSEHFSVLYAGSEFKPTYGHRRGYTDYTALDPAIFPDQSMDAWLRFDIPATADLKDLRLAFLPDSSQVGVSPSSPNYPWSEDHPTFVWEFGP